MKKSIFSLLCLFALSSFFTNIAFAGDPIPGITVGAGRNPGGEIKTTTKTTRDGKFTLSVSEKGKYDLKISYAEIVKIVSGLTKGKAANMDNYTFTLTLDSKSVGLIVNGKEVHEITITRQWAAANPQFIIPKEGGMMSGKLTYKANGSKVVFPPNAKVERNPVPSVNGCFSLTIVPNGTCCPNPGDVLIAIRRRMVAKQPLS